MAFIRPYGATSIAYSEVERIFMQWRMAKRLYCQDVHCHHFHPSLLNTFEYHGFTLHLHGLRASKRYEVLKDKTTKRNENILTGIHRWQIGEKLHSCKSIRDILVFAICMLPTHVTWLWHDFGNGSENPYGLFNKVATFSNILTYTNSLVNPFIFGSIMINFERFVNIFKNFICCRCLRRANDFYEIRSPSMSSQLANRSFFLSLSKPSDISSFEINEVVKATKITTKDHNSFATIFPWSNFPPCYWTDKEMKNLRDHTVIPHTKQETTIDYCNCQQL